MVIFILVGESISDEFPSFYKDVSLRIFDVLENIGVSTDLRDCMAECGKVDEILGTAQSLLPGVNMNFSGLCVGSYYEGTQTPGMGSDVDQIIVIEVPVVSKVSDCHGSPALLMVQDSNTPPGYAKLQPYELATETLLDKTYGFTIETVSDQCNRHVVKLNERRAETLFDIRQGPALKAFGNQRTMEQDYVCAFSHQNTTTCLAQWFERQRFYNQPDKSLLDLCLSMGCLLVNVGHRRSCEFDVEWRISFSLQERLLVAELNSVQHKCFVLLKMVKKEILQRLVQRESITSYHCKTCILYMVERTPSAFWVPENLLRCFVSCCKLILLWLLEGNCPNYFIPSENMFDGRLDIKVRAAACHAFQTILASNCQYLTVIESGDLGRNIVKRCVPRFHLIDIAKSADNGHSKRKLKLEAYKASVLGIVRMRNTMADKLYRNCQSNSGEFLTNLSNTIQRIKTVDHLAEHTSKDTRLAFSLILPMLEQNLISNRLAFKIKQDVIDETLWTYLSSNLWKEVGAKSDPITAKIKQAAFLHVCGYNAESLDVLASIESNSFISVCYCDEEHITYPDIDIFALDFPCDQNITLAQHFNKLLTPCVIFLPPEGELLPQPLRYEMLRARGLPLPSDVTFGKRNWYNWVVVDAHVLLHFLLYLNHKKLNMERDVKTDIGNLQKVIRKGKGQISHIETALNILGWVYFREDMPEEAGTCYGLSETFQPVYNSQRWHLRRFAIEEYLTFAL